MKKALMSLLATFILQVFNFASGVMIARALGAEDRGQYANIIAWYSFLVPIAMLGINDAIVYSISKGERPASKTISAAAVAALITIGLAIAAGCFVFFWIFRSQPPRVQIAAAIFMLYAPAYQLNQYLLSLFQSSGKGGFWNVMRIFNAPAYVGFIVIAILVGDGNIVGMATANIGSVILAVTILGIVAARRWKLEKPDPAVVKDLFHYGKYTIFQRITIVSRDNLDRMVLPLFVGMADLGHYTVAAAVAYFVFLIGYTIDMVAFPAIAGQSTLEGQKNSAQLFSRMGFVLTIGAMVCLAPLLNYLIPTLFGREFGPSVKLALWLLLAGGFQSFKMCLASVFKGLRRTKILALVDAGNALIMLVGLLTLPQRFGILGGCYAHLASAVFAVTALFIAAKVQLGLSWRAMLLPHLSDIHALLASFKGKTNAAATS
jgi:O-antigen/teichoic acid export membrane protein